MRRRRFLALVPVSAALAGCETGVPTDAESTVSSKPTGARGGDDDPPDGSIHGLVTDLDGEPLADASVAALATGSSVVASTTTDPKGRFGLDAGTSPRWLRVRHPDHLSAVRAVGPGRYTVRLTPSTGTVSFTFGGDVMFGRRFYESRSSSPAVQIDHDNPLPGHEAILAPIAPAFKAADIGSVNLETPLSSSDWRHPTKAYTFPSHPVAATALHDAGVNYAALGNNHAFDALEPGLADTRATLDDAGILFSGAGYSSDEAWKPATVEHRGVKVALISCSMLVGARYDVDWSADRNPEQTHAVTRDDGEQIRFSGAVGVAEPTEERLSARVTEAREEADVVVVQIHGGESYQRAPTDQLVRLADAAIAAGADVVANHHPHVTGGVEIRDGALVAWSLGNLVFDQELWETYRSALLTVHVSADGVRRASVEPVLRDRYVPKGVAGTVRERLLAEMAGWSGDAVSFRDETLSFVHGREPGTRRKTQTMTGEDALYARQSGWVEAVESAGIAWVGLDRLFTGGFADCLVDASQSGGTLWQVEGGRVRDGIGNARSPGVRLRGGEGAMLAPSDRAPVGDGPVTLTGLYRTTEGGQVTVHVGWFDGLAVEAGLPASRDPDSSEQVDLESTAGRWQRARIPFEPPAGTSYVHIRLEPAKGTTASFDNWELVDWTPAEGSVDRGRAYSHLRVDGSATIRFAVDGRGGLEGGVEWKPLD